MGTEGVGLDIAAGGVTGAGFGVVGVGAGGMVGLGTGFEIGAGVLGTFVP